MEGRVEISLKCGKSENWLNVLKLTIQKLRFSLKKTK